MIDFFDYERPPQIAPYDPYGTLLRETTADTSAEDKSRLLRNYPFTLASNAMGVFAWDDVTSKKKKSRRERGLAIGIVKIVLCTREEEYNEEVTTNFCLANAGEEAMDRAIMELQDSTAIERISKDGRQLPNRDFQFTKDYRAFHTAGMETLPFWEISKGIEDMLAKKEATIFRRNGDAEVAAVLSLISRDQVETKINLSGLEKLKADTLFNSKMLHDDALEVPIQLWLKDSPKVEAGRMEKWTNVLKGRSREEKGSYTTTSSLGQGWTRWSVKGGTLHHPKQAAPSISC